MCSLHGLYRIPLILLLTSLVMAGCATTLDNKSISTGADLSPSKKGLASTQTQPIDLWQRIRTGFALPEMDNRHVAHYEKWYSAHPDYLSRLTDRASKYLYFIVEQVEARGIPLEIALLPAIESAFNPKAESHARAVGVWQFIGSTGRLYGLKQNWWYDGRRDIYSATNAALDYLEKLHKQFNGDWFLALAAYNAGEGRVGRAIKYNRKRGIASNYSNLNSLKLETRRYVPKLLAFRNIIRSPESYGLHLKPISNKTYFFAVALGSQIDLKIISRKTSLTEQELRWLNPGFKRWATDPAGPHRLLVPIEKKAEVEQLIASIPVDKRLQWQRHTIRQGENLGQIARRYGISVSAIKSTNRIRGTNIRAGKSLLIPLSSSRFVARSKNIKKRQKPNTLAASKHSRQIHRVRNGDTLWAIAQRYDVYIAELTRWNSIRRGSLLQPGQKLLIYQN